MVSGARIVATARGWIGTRFHHQGRLKKSGRHKGGVDCLGLLIGVAKELDLQRQDGTPLTASDSADYSHYPDAARLRDELAMALCPLDIQLIRPGDIVLLSIDDLPQHLAIVSDMETGHGLIHAYAPARAVVEHALDAWWRQRIAAAYRLEAF